MIYYPESIKKNDIFGVVATSSGLSLEWYQKRLDKAYLNLKKLGYTCYETKSVRRNFQFVSNIKEARAKEFLDLWQDEKISVISQVYGGEFLMEILPFLDKDIILKHKPKWVTGFSDSSLLNYYLTTKYNIATLTTANIIHFGSHKLDKSLLDQLAILQTKKSRQESFSFYEKEKARSEANPYSTYNLDTKVVYKNLYSKKEEVITGRVIGGCIEALATIIGTKYDNTVSFCRQFEEGMLWYLENFFSDPLTLYRILWQMKEANWFFNCNGFLIGRTRGIFQVDDFSYLDALHKIFDDMKIPVIYDVDIGHLPPMWSMVNGSFGEFHYKNGKGYIIQDLK